MLRKILKNKKAQNTAEYAILISLVVAGIIAMQTYAQRALQARVRDAGQYLVTQTQGQGLGNTLQYEPYYLATDYTTTRNERNAKYMNATAIGQQDNSARTRAGSDTKSYGGALTGM